MHQRLQTRLAQLKSEYQAGQQMLAELEQKQRNLRETLLRISGAIQVLEEELGQAAPAPNQATPNGAEAPTGDFAP
jgi:septal ring factor EnvC (AmiA/AmiB activator)